MQKGEEYKNLTEAEQIEMVTAESSPADYLAEIPEVPLESPDLVQKRAETQEQDAIKIADIRESLGLTSNEDQILSSHVPIREQREPVQDNGDRLTESRKEDEIEKDRQIKNLCTKFSDSLDDILRIGNMKNRRGPAPFFSSGATSGMRTAGEYFKKLSRGLDVIDEKKVDELTEIFLSMTSYFDKKNLLALGATDEDEKKLRNISSALEIFMQSVSKFESQVSIPDAKKFGNLGAVASSLKNRLKSIGDNVDARKTALRNYLRH